MEHDYNYTIAEEINKSALPANANDLAITNDGPLVSELMDVHTVISRAQVARDKRLIPECVIRICRTSCSSLK